MKYFLALLALIIHAQASLGYCSSLCTYVQNMDSHQKGCQNADPTQCTACDERFFYLSGSQCLLSNGIYNETQMIPEANWIPLDSMAGVKTYDSVQWHSWVYKTMFTTTQTLPEGIYGLRIRLGMVFTFQSSSVHMYINAGPLSQQITNLQTSDSSYNLKSWIYTTEHFQYQHSSIIFALVRNDTFSVFNSIVLGFRSVVILVSKCVDSCLRCTDLSNCMKCSIGKYLHKGTHCISQCPDSTYPVITTIAQCIPCDPSCQTCAISPINCDKCTDSGTSEAFLQGSSCVQNCSNGYIGDQETHVCSCPAGKYELLGFCNECSQNCSACYGSQDDQCSNCVVGFFLDNATLMCVSKCPVGHFGNTIDELFICSLCDSSCYQCDLNATQCTSCNSPSALMTQHKYLSPSGLCVTICPDGFSGNTASHACQQCGLGSYSHQNDCLPNCPDPYTKSDKLHACILLEGYPLMLHVEIQNKTVIKFQLDFELGLSTESIMHLTDVNSRKFLTLMLKTKDSIIKLPSSTKKFVGSKSQSVLIDDMQLNGSRLIILSSKIKATDFINAESFSIQLNENLQSPLNVIYALHTESLSNQFHIAVFSFLYSNLTPLFLIGVFLSLIPLIVLLFRIRHTYRILIEFIQCLQLVGLMLFSVYPHSASLSLFSLLVGLDFSNFSFVYNAPRLLLSPCSTCLSIPSYIFVQGDMNWLRLMGSMLQTFSLLMLLYLILCCFACSRKYSRFMLILICDLIFVKVIHSWMASFIYMGMNYSSDSKSILLFTFSMHFIGSIMTLILVYRYLKRQWVNNYANVSFICLILFVCLESMVSVSPLLISSIILLVTLIQWSVIYVLELNQNELPKSQSLIQPLDQTISVQVRSSPQPSQKDSVIDHNSEQNQLNTAQAASEKGSLLTKCHTHLLRSLKPITALLVSLIALVEPINGTKLIIVISVIFSVLLILIMIVSCLIYSSNNEIEDNAAVKKTSLMTIQDMIPDGGFEKGRESLKGKHRSVVTKFGQINEDSPQGKFRKKNSREPIVMLNDQGFDNESRGGMKQ